MKNLFLILIIVLPLFAVSVDDKKRVRKWYTKCAKEYFEVLDGKEAYIIRSVHLDMESYSITLFLDFIKSRDSKIVIPMTCTSYVQITDVRSLTISPTTRRCHDKYYKFKNEHLKYLDIIIKEFLVYVKKKNVKEIETNPDCIKVDNTTSERFSIGHGRGAFN